MNKNKLKIIGYPEQQMTLKVELVALDQSLFRMSFSASGFSLLEMGFPLVFTNSSYGEAGRRLSEASWMRTSFMEFYPHGLATAIPTIFNANTLSINI